MKLTRSLLSLIPSHKFDLAFNKDQAEHEGDNWIAAAAMKFLSFLALVSFSHFFSKKNFHFFRQELLDRRREKNQLANHENQNTVRGFSIFVPVLLLYTDRGS